MSDRDIQLKNIMQEILVRYEGCLDNTALTQMVYLADTEFVRRYEYRLTNIDWHKTIFGPFSRDILNCAEKHFQIFQIEKESENRNRIVLIKKKQIVFSEKIAELIDYIIKTVPNPKFDFSEFSAYVYNTAPMILLQGNGKLDIKKAVTADKEAEELFEILNTPEWNEAFEYLAAH